MAQKYSVYISYSWANEIHNEIEEPVLKLRKLMEKEGIKYKIDKGDGKYSLVDYLKNLKEAEDELANGDVVIVVLSAKYLTSLHSLYELHGLLKRKDWQKRIFPIILSGINIDDTLLDSCAEEYKYIYTDLTKGAIKGSLTEIQSNAYNERCYLKDGKPYDLINLKKFLDSHNVPTISEDKDFDDVIKALKERVGFFKVYICYAWSKDHNPEFEDDVNGVQQILKDNNIAFKLDDNCLGLYENSIVPDKSIVKDHLIIVAISEKFLKSLLGLYQLHCILANCSNKNVIFLVLNDVCLTDFNTYVNSYKQKVTDIIEKRNSGKCIGLEEGLAFLYNYEKDLERFFRECIPDAFNIDDHKQFIYKLKMLCDFNNNPGKLQDLVLKSNNIALSTFMRSMSWAFDVMYSSIDN